MLKSLSVAAALCLTGCAIPVRPIAHLEADPLRPGTMHFTPDADQEPQIGPAMAGGAGFLSQFLPSPYRELLGIAATAYIGEKRRQTEAKKLQQTVDGIEAAKGDMDDKSVDALHGALAEAQDDSTKKTVWDMRP